MGFIIRPVIRITGLAYVIISSRLKLFTLDPQTGKINSTFGKDGILDLHTPDVMGNFPHGFLQANSMPVMYQNVIIVGSRGQESPPDGPRGDVRGIDIISGKTLWKFDAIPQPLESQISELGKATAGKTALA